MILGNKCDMEDKRQVPRERGESVCIRIHEFNFLAELYFLFVCRLYKINLFNIHITTNKTFRIIATEKGFYCAKAKSLTGTSYAIRTDCSGN